MFNLDLSAPTFGACINNNRSIKRTKNSTRHAIQFCAVKLLCKGRNGDNQVAQQKCAVFLQVHIIYRIHLIHSRLRINSPASMVFKGRTASGGNCLDRFLSKTFLRVIRDHRLNEFCNSRYTYVHSRN